MDHTSPTGYGFDGYLAGLEGNWLEEDSLLRGWLGRSRLDEVALDWVRGFGAAAAGRFRARAEVVERRGVPTARGGAWGPGSVLNVERRARRLRGR